VVVAGILNGVAGIPFAISVFHAYFRQVLSNTLLDAAALGGAGISLRFHRIAAHMARPAIASVFALAVSNIWK